MGASKCTFLASEGGQGCPKTPPGRPKTVPGRPWDAQRRGQGGRPEPSATRARIRTPFWLILGIPLGVSFRSFFDPVGVQFLIVFWVRLGRRPGAARGDQKSLQKRVPEKEALGRRKLMQKTSQEGLLIVKILSVFIVFSENRPFGARAAAETEKASKMTSKSSQNGGPEGTRNG